MGKKMMILFVVCGITFLCAGCFVFREFEYKKPLPEKYANYKKINEIEETDKYRIIKLNTEQERELYIDRINEYVLLTTVSNNYEACTYRKIDFNGNSIDSITVKNAYFDNISRYLLHQDCYNTWCIDGNKTNQNYITVNKELKLNREELVKEFNKLLAESKKTDCRGYYVIKDDPIATENKIDRVYFLKQKQWICLYGNDLVTSYLIDKTSKSDTADLLRPLAINYWFTKGNYSEIKSDKFYLEYFQRAKYFRKRLLSSFNPNGARASCWVGYGYVNIIMKHDTLKLKMEMEEVTSSGSVYGKPLYLYVSTH